MEAKHVADYSPRNIQLILSANPDATLLAGYKQWQKLGRQVRKGERGIPIGAPVTAKQDDGTTKMVNVRGARVFDVSQTDALDSECACDPETGVHNHPAPGVCEGGESEITTERESEKVPEEDTPEGEAFIIGCPGCDHPGTFEHDSRCTVHVAGFKSEPTVQVHESQASDSERTENVRKAVRSYEETLEEHERDPFAAMRESLRG